MMLKYCEIANCNSASERTQTRKQAPKTKNTMLDKIFMMRMIKNYFVCIQLNQFAHFQNFHALKLYE